MKKTDSCAFCGKFLNKTEMLEINGEHIFPAFMCKKNFGDLEESKALQEQIKVSVCKECNSKYGNALETKLSKIIDGLKGKIDLYMFRTEEALCLLDYVDKTRILLQHWGTDVRQKDILGKYNAENLWRQALHGRQVLIVRANVPDGVYFPAFLTDNATILKTKLGYISSRNPADWTSVIAVSINNIVIIGLSNNVISSTLGFPYFFVEQDRQTLSWYHGEHDIDNNRLAWYVAQDEIDNGNMITLAQPSTHPVDIAGLSGDYELKRSLTKQHNGYKYGVYFKSGTSKGWLTKMSTERGSKSIKFNLMKQYSYDEFLKLLEQVSKMEILFNTGCANKLIKNYDVDMIYDEIMKLEFYYTNILSNPFTENAVEYIQKKYGFEKAKSLINALNLVHQDTNKWFGVLDTNKEK